MAYREIYRVDALPVLQNRMFSSREEALNCPVGDIVLVRDMTSGLIFNQAYQPGLIQYGVDYQNEQAVSRVFLRHLQQITGIIRKYFHGETLIEIGCGKGYFLEHLHAQGFQITGLDPTYEGNNQQIIRAEFAPEICLHADGLILRHVLEHVLNPVEFLGQLRDANGGSGKIYIEVPCFDWICTNRAWFDVFYEHVNYFRLDDFYRIFGKVHEAGRTFGGQYLSIVADLSSLQKVRMKTSDNFTFPADFLGKVTRYAEQIKTSYFESPRKHQIIWGGASKGVVFSLFMRRAGASVDFVVDINPAKQGKYLASTGLMVHSLEEIYGEIDKNSTIFVMNGNYLSEIREMTFNKFKYCTVDQ